MRRLIIILVLLSLMGSLPAHAGRTFADGIRYTINAAVVTAAPMTMCAWVRPTTLGIVHGIMAVGTDGSDNQRFSLTIEPANVVRWNSRALADVTAQTTATVTINVWSHVCGVEASSTSRAVYLNGTNKVSSSTSSVVSTPNRTWLANDTGASGGRELNGDLAEATIWNAALTDAEIAALATGVHPSQGRPAARVSCAPLWGQQSPEIDTCGARVYTATGTPTVATTRPPVALFNTLFGR